ncbi:MAG: hypothetical protein IT393_08695 [Nitrospirae bacterium]|nr:hypothetical protein [Nitrospirota bacterium]
MEACEDILKEKLSKRVLSNKTTREGMLACLVVTRMKFLALRGTPQPEDSVRKAVYDYAGEAFTSIGVDFEFPNLEDLKKVKAIVEGKIDISSIRQEAPELFSEHESICNILFQKFEG